MGSNQQLWVYTASNGTLMQLGNDGGADGPAYAEMPPADLPGAKPTFFFAPTHMGKRDKDWGPGKFWQKASAASIKVTQDTAALLNIVSRTGADEANASWLGLLDNKVPGSTGLIVSI